MAASVAAEAAELNFDLHPKQDLAFNSPATEILYGGAAGGGKSHLMRIVAILWCASIPGLQVYLFRRLRDDLIKNHMEGPSGFRNLLAGWVACGFCVIIEDQIRFWNGSKIYLCHCKDEAHRFKYQGAEIHVLIIDELTHFTEKIYRFLRNRVRMVGITLPAQYKGKFPRILCGANPGGIGHQFVKATFIDGVAPLRIYRAANDEGGMLRQYIPAKLEDNPSMADQDPGYENRLNGLGSEALVKAMRDGDWDIIEGAFFDCCRRQTLVRLSHGRLRDVDGSWLMATEVAAPFVWGDAGAQLTPSQIAARRQVAAAMMQQGMDYSPVKSAWQGAARVAQSLLGTADSMSADSAEEKGRREAIAQALEVFRGGQPGASSSPAASVSGGPVSAAPAAPASSPGTVDTSGVVTVGPNDPSPLDPPVGADRDLAIRTVYGEAGNEPSEGQRAVAAVIRNRAADGNYGGTTIPGVVLAPNQFEPWNGGVAKQRMLALSPDDPKYKAIGDQVDAAYFGANDPTDGATHFFSPGGQAALGRRDPSWAKGDFTEIGGHRFYSPDDQPPMEPVRVASATPFAPADAPADASALPPGMPASGLPEAGQRPSRPSPGTATVAQAMQPQAAAAPAAPGQGRPGVDAIARVMANPFLPAPLATALSAQLKPRDRHVQETDAAGNIWDVNQLTGQRTVALKKDPAYTAPYRDEDGNLVQKDASGKISVVSAAEKTPQSVQEHEHYKKNFQPTELTPKPMPYEAWVTAKARAGASTVNNNIGGGTDKQIFDTFDERSKEARATATGLVALRNARAALEGDGGAITGFRANERLALQKAGSYLGVSDPKAIQNTETFRAAIAPQVAAMLKSTVGTANISNSDREFAEKAAGGSITLDAGSIKRLLDIMERGSVARLQLHQEQLDAVYPDPVANKRERAIFGIKVPTPAAPPAGATKSGIKWSVE